MTFYLTASGGSDEGRTFKLENGDYLIGRSPSSKVVLKDEKVAWEHALLKVDGSNLMVQNLSASGTRVKGRKIAEPTRVGNHDEIQLTDDCRLIVEQRVGGAGHSTPLVVGLLLALMVMLVGVAYSKLTPDGPARRPMEPRHWRQAYTGLVTRMEDWSRSGYFPNEAVLMFRNAWRLDQVEAYRDAAKLWEQIHSLLLSMPVPGAPPEDTRTCAQIAGPTTKSLEALMGYDLQNTMGDSDESYVDALVWFAKKRAQRTRTLAKK